MAQIIAKNLSAKNEDENFGYSKSVQNFFGYFVNQKCRILKNINLIIFSSLDHTI